MTGTKTDATNDATSSAVSERHPLDHDGDGRPGGVAPPPPVQHLVLLADDPERDWVRGDVVAGTDEQIRPLLKARRARLARPDEVDLAQPRIRPL